MADCVFCKIGDHSIPSNIVYEDDQIICFHDLEPQAPVHVLVIPKKHIESLDDVKEEDKELMGHIMVTIKKIAADMDACGGYRNHSPFVDGLRHYTRCKPRLCTTGCTASKQYRSHTTVWKPARHRGRKPADK